jgi:hypothetical protein
MTNLRPGDRVRVCTQGDGLLPLIRYGWIGSVLGPDGPLVVMFDGELGGELIGVHQADPVCITSIEIRLEDLALVDDADLRRGLVALWRAEADEAGLAIESLHAMGAHGDGLRDSSDGWALAEVMSAGQQYVLRVATEPTLPGVLLLRADPPNRWG